MKQKTYTILISLVGLTILFSLLIAKILTDNHTYIKIGSSLLGIFMGISTIITIKRDNQLTWQSSLFLLVSIWFVVNPWLND